MRRSLILCVIALLVGGCGSDAEPDRARTSGEDLIAAATTTAANAAPAERDECTAKGLNDTKLGTGRCTDADDVTFVVVNRNGTLNMDDVAVRLVKTHIVKSVDGGALAPTVKAQGRFVIFQFRLKNRSKRPVIWSSGSGATALQIGDTLFTPDDSTAAYSLALKIKNDPGTEASDIQPGQRGDGWVAFDVPVNMIGKLKQRGSKLLVVAAADALNGYPAASGTATVRGTIRLWR